MNHRETTRVAVLGSLAAGCKSWFAKSPRRWRCAMNRRLQRSELPLVSPLPIRGEGNLPDFLTPQEIAGLLQLFELLDAWDRKETEKSQ